MKGLTTFPLSNQCPTEHPRFPSYFSGLLPARRSPKPKRVLVSLSFLDSPLCEAGFEVVLFPACKGFFLQPTSGSGVCWRYARVRPKKSSIQREPERRAGISAQPEVRPFLATTQELSKVDESLGLSETILDKKWGCGNEENGLVEHCGDVFPLQMFFSLGKMFGAEA